MRDSRTGYLVPGHVGPGLRPDSRVLGKPPSPPPPPPPRAPSSSEKRIVSQWSERIVGPIGRLFSRNVEKASEILIFAVSWQSLQGYSRLAPAPADYSRRACFGSRENSWPVRPADYSRGLADYSRDRPTILAEGTGRLFSRTKFGRFFVKEHIDFILLGYVFHSFFFTF